MDFFSSDAGGDGGSGGSGSGGDDVDDDDDDDDVRMDTKLQVLQGKKEVLKCDWEF